MHTARAQCITFPQRRSWKFKQGTWIIFCGVHPGRWQLPVLPIEIFPLRLRAKRSPEWAYMLACPPIPLHIMIINHLQALTGMHIEYYTLLPITCNYCLFLRVKPIIPTHSFTCPWYSCRKFAMQKSAESSHEWYSCRKFAIFLGR